LFDGLRGQAVAGQAVFQVDPAVGPRRFRSRSPVVTTSSRVSFALFFENLDDIYGRAGCQCDQKHFEV
jgi:hypothetical protein